MDATAEDVLRIIAEKGQIDRDRLSPDARLVDLAIASLDVIEIVFALEERFRIDIPYNANQGTDGGSGGARLEFDTVGDIVRAVEATLRRRSTG